MKNNEIKIGDNTILFDELEQTEEGEFTFDSGVSKTITWTAEQIENSLKPVVSIVDSVRNTIKDSEPKTIELSMNVNISLKGEVPIFKIVSAGASSQIGIKIVWKASDNSADKN